MADHHLAEAAVIGLPESHADAEVDLPAGGIETGVGGEPTRTAIGAGQLGKPLLPDAAVAIAKLAVGVGTGQGPVGKPVALIEGGHQVGLVVALEPHGPARFHQAPGQLHGAANLGPAVDHIPAKDEAIAAGQSRYQSF